MAGSEFGSVITGEDDGFVQELSEKGFLGGCKGTVRKNLFITYFQYTVFVLNAETMCFFVNITIET